MTEEELRRLQGVLGSMSSAMNSWQAIQTTNANIIANENKLKTNAEITKVAEENKNQFTLQKDYIKDRREENETEIANLIKDIGDYNVNAMDWSELDDVMQTEDGKKLLAEQGLEYGENFRLREKFQENADLQLETSRNLIGLQELIIDDLTKKKNEILDLNKDWMKVGTKAGYKNLKDTEDVKAYIKENYQKFLKPSYVNPDGSKVWTPPPAQGSGMPYKVPRLVDNEGNIRLEDTTLADELNPLGMAFMKTKDSPTGKGFAPTSFTPGQFEQAGLTKEGIPKTDVENDELEVLLNDNFALLSDAMARVKAKDKDTKWADDMGLGDFVKSVKGEKKLWDNQDAGATLKSNIEMKILDMLDEATDYSWVSGFFSEGKSGANVRDKFKLDKARTNPLLREAVIASIFDEYAGDDILTLTNKETGVESTSAVPREKTVGGKLNKAYANDKVHFTTYSGGDYGEAPEDDVFYYLLKTWKPLHNAFATAQK